MGAYRDRSQNLGPRADVDMTADFRRAALANTECYLLKQQAIWPDLGVRVDDYAVRMRQQQTAAQFAIQGNIGAGHYAPTPVSQYRANSWQRAPDASRRSVALI